MGPHTVPLFDTNWVDLFAVVGNITNAVKGRLDQWAAYLLLDLYGSYGSTTKYEMGSKQTSQHKLKAHSH